MYVPYINILLLEDEFCFKESQHRRRRRKILVIIVTIVIIILFVSLNILG